MSHYDRSRTDYAFPPVCPAARRARDLYDPRIDGSTPQEAANGEPDGGSGGPEEAGDAMPEL